MRNQTIASVIVLLAMLTSTGYAQDSRVDTPQLAFESFKTAFEKNDWDTMYSAISPGRRDYMIFESIFGLGMDDSDPEAKAITTKYVDQAKLESLYAAFKIRPTTAQTIELYSQVIKNKKGMFVDGLKYFENKAKHNLDLRPNPRFGQLSDLVIDKKVAAAKSTLTSTVVHYSNAGGDAKDVRHEKIVTREERVYFINLDGKWLYATPEEWQQHNANNSGRRDITK